MFIPKKCAECSVVSLAVSRAGGQQYPTEGGSQEIPLPFEDQRRSTSCGNGTQCQKCFSFLFNVPEKPSNPLPVLVNWWIMSRHSWKPNE